MGNYSILNFELTIFSILAKTVNQPIQPRIYHFSGYETVTEAERLSVIVVYRLIARAYQPRVLATRGNLAGVGHRFGETEINRSHAAAFRLRCIEFPRFVLSSRIRFTRYAISRMINTLG